MMATVRKCPNPQCNTPWKGGRYCKVCGYYPPRDRYPELFAEGQPADQGIKPGSLLTDHRIQGKVTSLRSDEIPIYHSPLERIIIDLGSGFFPIMVTALFILQGLFLYYLATSIAPGLIGAMARSLFDIGANLFFSVFIIVFLFAIFTGWAGSALGFGRGGGSVMDLLVRGLAGAVKPIFILLKLLFRHWVRANRTITETIRRGVSSRRRSMPVIRLRIACDTPEQKREVSAELRGIPERVQIDIGDTIQADGVWDKGTFIIKKATNLTTEAVILTRAPRFLE